MTELHQLPFDRSDLLEISPIYATLRASAPVTKILTPTGDEAWLVTGHREVRQAFADHRLGRSHPTPESAPRLSHNPLMGGPSGDYATERAVHEAMRRFLAPAFSARRMRTLTDRVQLLVDELLDDLAAAGPPADLHQRLSLPLPIRVICELLGVPYEDRAKFQRMSQAMGDMKEAGRSAAAFDELSAYAYSIVESKRVHPAEDVFSDLASANLSAGDIARLAAGLLFAGHETTVTRIDYGVLFLLRSPEQRDALVRDPSLASDAVEEILRMASPGQHGVIRYAHEDLEIGDVKVRAGELVLLSIGAANRDEKAYPDAERFDIFRPAPTPHVGLGHGVRYCAGASLARVELQAVFSSLFQRFPTLRLAVPQEELRERNDLLTGGVAELPVTW
jgi:pentalenolactone synthase